MSQSGDYSDCVVIRLKTHNELVLDSSDATVRLKPYDGSSSQRWKLKLAVLGRIYITIPFSGTVLTLSPEDNPNNRITTLCLNGEESQQWYINSDGTIVTPNPVDNLAVTVWESKYTSGTILTGRKHHGNPDQQFLLTPYREYFGPQPQPQPLPPPRVSPRPLPVMSPPLFPLRQQSWSKRYQQLPPSPTRARNTSPLRALARFPGLLSGIAREPWVSGPTFAHRGGPPVPRLTNPSASPPRQPPPPYPDSPQARRNSSP